MIRTMKECFTEFEYRCLTNRWDPHTDLGKIERLWDAAKTKEDFVKALQKDEELKWTQACGVLSKNDFYYIRGMVGEHQLKTECEAGSVRIGNGDFRILIPTGGGDGVARVGILPEGAPFNDSALTYFTLLEGCFDIYWHDCGIPVKAAELEGRFHVFYGAGFVIFVPIPA